MLKHELSKGEDRTKVSLSAHSLGKDLVVTIYNEGAHIGAMALGEWDKEHERASVSVVTRLGHKDDAIAQRAAYLICKAIKKPVCIIAGVHLEQISMEEIDEILQNADAVLGDVIRGWGRRTRRGAVL
ncbi:MAG: hypothetical protein Q8O16_06060 [Dehalococcoidia bacterium]|nr:hypothetical protein [Dehalococcoidia bacterium]